VSGNLDLIAVNVGLPKPLGLWHGEPVLSAFDKQPVSGA
jgi:hypothetical protein